MKVKMPELVKGRKIVSATFLTPEQPDEMSLVLERKAGRLGFEVPEFLVYGVVRLILAP